MLVKVIAHPNAKRPRIDKDLLGDLHVYVNAPALEGKANKAIIDSLANYFTVKKNKVVLIFGSKSKRKVFEVQ